MQIHKYCRTPDIVLQRRMSVSSGPDIYDRHFDRALRARHPTISTDIERAMDRAGNFAGCRALLPGWTELVSFEMRVVEKLDAPPRVMARPTMRAIVSSLGLAVDGACAVAETVKAIKTNALAIRAGQTNLLTAEYARNAKNSGSFNTTS
ncbi:MAG: hypothetical protein DMG93_11255 [Acidobacteria bacterium]|nr:MAG: hypothetical protein DMG93_11255 [Acidobacteriota bacterium]